MSKRLIRNLLQAIVALLLVLPTSMFTALPVAADGPVDLDIQKDIDDSGVWGSGTTVYAGDTVTFEVSVYNESGNPAEDVAVYDYMPPGFVLVPGSVSGGYGYVEVSPGVYRFDLGTVGAWNNDIFYYDVTIDPNLVANKDGYMEVDNSVTVAVEGEFAFDTDLVDNTDNLRLDVFELSEELELLKIDAHPEEPSVAGAPNEYYMGVMNYGPSAARDVQLFDTLSPDEEFLFVEFVEGEGDCSYIASTHTVWCRLGTVSPSDFVDEPGEDPFYLPSVSLIIHTMVASSVPEGAILENCAEIIWPMRTGLGSETVLYDDECWENVVDRQVNLKLSKESMPNPVTAGETLFYAITVTNEGPSDAEDVRLRDVLPAGVTFVAAADNGEWNETTPGELYVLNRPLPAGDSASIVFEVMTDTSLFIDTLPETLITNTASARTIEMIADELDWVETAEDTFVAEEADLHIVKVGKPDGQVLAGEELEYTVYVYNLGPSDARNVLIRDDIVSREGVQIVGDPEWIEGEGAGSSIVWPVGDLDWIELGLTWLAAGDRAAYRVVVTADDAVDVNNLVKVSSDTPDPDESNNFDETMHEFVPVADLSVAKYLIGGEPVAGTEITFQYDVENLGPSDATNVVLKEYIPDGLTYVSNTGPDCTLDGSVLTCAYGNILAGGLRTGLQITFAIDPAFEHGKTLLNTVEVSSDVLDAHRRNNVDVWAEPVSAQSDVSLQKFAVGDAVAGEVIHYEFQIANNGPSVAQDVWLRDFLPQGVELVSASVDVGEGKCNLTMGSNALFCDLGDLEPGAFVLVFANVRIKSDVAAGEMLTNSASVNLLHDPDVANNTDMAAVTVDRVVNLSISKQGNPNPVVAGDKLYYSVIVTNNGPSDASNLVVSDVLPAGVTFIAMADAGEWIEVVPGSQWQLPVLAAGQSAEFMIEAQTATNLYVQEMDDDMLVINQVTVVCDENPDGTSAEEDTYIDESADLLIKKVGKPDEQVLAGEVLEYTIQVYNLGLSDARNVMIDDDIVSLEGVDIVDVEWIEVDPLGYGSFVDDTNDLLKLWADRLPAGTRMVAKITVTSDEPVDVNNLVHVEADTPDPDMSNNDAATMHEIVAVSDLSVTKTHVIDPMYASELWPEAFVAGLPGIFVVEVTNNGPSEATNVVAKDWLPAGLKLLGVDSLTGDYGWTGGTPGDPGDPVQVNIGNMEAGETAIFNVLVLVDADCLCESPFDWAGWLINSVEVSSDNLDTNKADNVDTAIVAVVAEADLTITKDEDPDPVFAGETVDWALVITNNGPSVATQVGVADYLPPQVEFLSGEVFAGEANVTFSEAYGNLVVAEIGDLMPGDQVGIVLHTRVKSDTDEGYIVNEALVMSDPLEMRGIFDPYLENNFAYSSTMVERAVDLAVTKTDDPDPVIAGADLYYTITVSNDGPSDASEILVVDVLSPDVTYLGWTGSNDFEPSGPGEWSLDYLAAGDSRSFMVHVRVNADTVSKADESTVISNMVSVMSQQQELHDLDNTYIEETFVNEAADLYVVKMGSPVGSVRAGDLLTYTIYVYNQGLSDARHVVLTDDLLSDGLFTIEDVAYGPPYECVVGETDITCTAAVHPAGARAEITITATATEDVDITNWTCVQSVTPDQNTDNNCSEVITSVMPVSDLSIVKTVLDAEMWVAGETIAFLIEAYNDGPSTAENVVIEDYLPANVSVIDVDFAGSEAGYTLGVPGDPNAPMVLEVGTLEPGETWSVMIELLIDSDYPFDPYIGGEFLVNGVKISSDVFDDDQSDNRDTEAVFITSISEVYVEKNATPDPVMAGEAIEYWIQVYNSGPSMAHDAVLWDGFNDEYLDYVGYEIVGGAGECSYTAMGMVFCELGDLKANTVRDVFLTFMVGPDTPNETMIGNGVELDAASGIEGVFETWRDVLVINNADLTVTKTADKMEVYAGQALTYSITTTNNGPTTAWNVMVTDTLPEGVTYINDDLGACMLDSGELTCALGDLAVGASVTFDVLVQVDADTVGVLTNHVSVESDTVDLGADNNGATVTTPVNGYADLRVVKFGKPEGEVRAGDELTYTILVNNLGTGVAHEVMLVDEMFSNGDFELIGVDSSMPVNDTLAELVGEFSMSGGFTLTLADDLPITVGGDAWLVTVRVMALDDQTINNCATVSSVDFDPNLDNNEACAEHDITNVADLSVTKTAEGEVQVTGEEGGVVEMDDQAVTAGRFLFYTLTVANDGPSMAENVVVTDMLPAGVEFIESDPAAIPNEDSGDLTWALGDLASGDDVVIEIKVLVPAHTPEGTVLWNTATVTSDIFDDDNGDNTDAVDTYVGASADITVSKESTPETSLPGNDIDYTILVKNLGPSDAGLVRIIDIIPDEIDGASWSYTTDGGITYTDGYLDVDAWVDMPVEEMVELTVSGIVNTYWPFENQVCANAVAVSDPLEEDNCDWDANEPFLVFKPIEMRGFEDTMHGPDLVISKIVATSTYIEVTVTNVGDRHLLEPFWVDLYVSPDPEPTAVNQLWEDLCETSMGWAWKVTGDDGLPLAPGESLVLVVDDSESAMFPLAHGLTVYAQADSWNPYTDYGMVYEQDERLGLPYNNIDWGTVGRVWGWSAEDGATRDEDSLIRGAQVFGAADDGLPARP